jgi:hypothetical protein
MQTNESHRVRAALNQETNLVWMSSDSKRLVVAERPSKLRMMTQSDFDEDPFNLQNDNEDVKDMKCKYSVSKEVDLGVGSLMMLERFLLNSQLVFVVVSNDRALVVLDDDLNELFRNEELIKDDDLCFFTSIAWRDNFQGALQSNPFNSQSSAGLIQENSKHSTVKMGSNQHPIISQTVL